MPGWVTIDEREVDQTTPPAAGGTAQASFATPDSQAAGARWRLQRLTLILVTPAGATSVAGTTAFVFVDVADTLHQRTGTPAGTGDFNVWEAQGSPLIIDPSRELLVLWTGVPDGYVGKCVAQVEIQLPDGTVAPPRAFLS